MNPYDADVRLLGASWRYATDENVLKGVLLSAIEHFVDLKYPYVVILLKNGMGI